MEMTPKEDMKKFINGYTLMERQGIRFLQSQARQLAQLMDKYKTVKTPMIVHNLRPKLDDLIDDEIESAVKAYDKKLQSKNERHKIAEMKYREIEREFFSLFSESL